MWQWSHPSHSFPFQFTMLAEYPQGTSVSPPSSQVTLLQCVHIPLPVHHMGRPWNCVCLPSTTKHQDDIFFFISVHLGVERNEPLSFCHLAQKCLPQWDLSCCLQGRRDICIFATIKSFLSGQDNLSRRVWTALLLIPSWSGLLRSYLWEEC